MSAPEIAKKNEAGFDPPHFCKLKEVGKRTASIRQWLV
jgi:hypothetical protein